MLSAQLGQEFIQDFGAFRMFRPKMRTVVLNLFPPVSLLCFPVAQQYDRVFVCRRAESRSVEAALHQTPITVQVSWTPVVF